MEQISNDVLVDAIDHMKKNPDFKKFIRLCEKRLTNFENKKTFNYDTRNVSGKKVKKSFDFGANPEILKYVSTLNGNVEELMCCDSQGLLKWKKKFEAINLDKLDPDVKKGFESKILTLLQYKTLRSGDDKLLFHFYKQLGVKACVYCNSQHVILLITSELARLQADHNLPKASYPYFSISLANLYPSCNNCNHLKKEYDIQYQLYYIDRPKREIGFELPPAQIAKFYSQKLTEDDITIKFNQGATKLDDILNITQIYENHKDYVVDLLRKHKIYKKSYVSTLASSFNGLFGGKEDLVNRMIFGSTLKNEDINQRVFSKLTNDIKKQLNELSD